MNPNRSELVAFVDLEERVFRSLLEIWPNSRRGTILAAITPSSPTNRLFYVSGADHVK